MADEKVSKCPRAHMVGGACECGWCYNCERTAADNAPPFKVGDVVEERGYREFFGRDMIAEVTGVRSQFQVELLHPGGVSSGWHDAKMWVVKGAGQSPASPVDSREREQRQGARVHALIDDVVQRGLASHASLRDRAINLFRQISVEAHMAGREYERSTVTKCPFCAPGADPFNDPYGPVAGVRQEGYKAGYIAAAEKFYPTLRSAILEAPTYVQQSVWFRDRAMTALSAGQIKADEIRSSFTRPRDMRCPDCGQMMTNHVIVTRHEDGACDEAFTGPPLATAETFVIARDVLAGTTEAKPFELPVEMPPREIPTPHAPLERDRVGAPVPTYAEDVEHVKRTGAPVVVSTDSHPENDVLFTRRGPADDRPTLAARDYVRAWCLEPDGDLRIGRIVDANGDEPTAQVNWWAGPDAFTVGWFLKNALVRIDAKPREEAEAVRGPASATPEAPDEYTTAERVAFRDGWMHGHHDRGTGGRSVEQAEHDWSTAHLDEPRPVSAQTDSLSEEVARMVHAFSDDGRKQAVRDLAARARRLEEERDRWLNWAADNQELHERASRANYERGLAEGQRRASDPSDDLRRAERIDSMVVNAGAWLPRHKNALVREFADVREAEQRRASAFPTREQLLEYLDAEIEFSEDETQKITIARLRLARGDVRVALGLVPEYPPARPVEAATGAPVAAGQIRSNKLEQIKVFGSYGFGSGGLLFSVSHPGLITSRASSGMSEKEIAETYPTVIESGPNALPDYTKDDALALALGLSPPNTPSWDMLLAQVRHAVDRRNKWNEQALNPVLNTGNTRPDGTYIGEPSSISASPEVIEESGTTFGNAPGDAMRVQNWITRHFPGHVDAKVKNDMMALLGDVREDERRRAPTPEVGPKMQPPAVPGNQHVWPCSDCCKVCRAWPHKGAYYCTDCQAKRGLTAVYAPGGSFIGYDEVPHPHVDLPRPDDEAIANALRSFVLVNESQRPILWQAVRRLVEMGNERAARFAEPSTSVTLSSAYWTQCLAVIDAARGARIRNAPAATPSGRLNRALDELDSNEEPPAIAAIPVGQAPLGVSVTGQTGIKLANGYELHLSTVTEGRAYLSIFTGWGSAHENVKATQVGTQLTAEEAATVRDWFANHTRSNWVALGPYNPDRCERPDKNDSACHCCQRRWRMQAADQREGVAKVDIERAVQFNDSEVRGGFPVCRSDRLAVLLFQVRTGVTK